MNSGGRIVLPLGNFSSFSHIRSADGFGCVPTMAKEDARVPAVIIGVQVRRILEPPHRPPSFAPSRDSKHGAVFHRMFESVKADKVLPAGTTSKPSPAASAEITLPFPAGIALPTFAVQSCAPVVASSA